MLRALPHHQGSGARGGALRRAAPARALPRAQRAPRRAAAAAAPRLRARPADDDAEPVPPALLPPLASAAALDAEAAWLAGILRVYLDEEWLAQPEVHGAVGAAAGEAYRALRRNHARAVEVGDVVLAVAQALAAQQGLFREAFCGPFDVANAVAELLMLRRGGAECGCGVFTSVSVGRFELILAAERTAAQS
jgi:hypothetical protein